MAKIADYLISGIWKSEDRSRISDVFLHGITDDNKFIRGVKTPESDVINLIENDKKIKTLVWSYKDAKWLTPVDVIVSENEGGKYLKTSPDDSESDNLLHLINMLSFV